MVSLIERTREERENGKRVKMEIERKSGRRGK